MSAFELLMISSIMMLVFATKMKMWKTSLNSYVVVLMTAVVSASYQTPELYVIFENKVWIFNAVLIFIFSRTAYQSITHKYQEMNAMQKEVEDAHMMLNTIGDTIPDMLWLKDIDGKYVYANLYDSDGKLVGVCGTGRDMTEYVTAYRHHECGKCPLMKDIFAKYEFKE